MSKESTAAQQLQEKAAETISAAQVADFLRANPDFFVSHEDLLAELRLPHESGRAISLLERQVTILRHRGQDARVKLNNLLDNARSNDQLFETVRDLVLALLRARDANEIAQVAQDRLSQLENIDACEILLARHSGLRLADNLQAQTVETLKQEYQDIFRLRRTHCGKLEEAKVRGLFPAETDIKSTALCPIMHGDQIIGLLALGNRQENYFNLNLDTLFLDFIGNVIGAVLGRELTQHG